MQLLQNIVDSWYWLSQVERLAGPGNIMSIDLVQSNIKLRRAASAHLHIQI